MSNEITEKNVNYNSDNATEITIPTDTGNKNSMYTIIRTKLYTELYFINSTHY